MSERWDAGTNGADDWDGWGSGRTASASSRPPLRRHSQPRDTEVDGTPPGFGDGAGSGNGFGDGSGLGNGFGRAPDPGVPWDGDTVGEPRVPGGRRPDPSSFDPVLTPLPGSLAADDPRNAPSSLSVGVICSAPSQPPGSLNTTTSPRCRSKIPGVSLLTSTRSPTSRVFSIEGDGMKNACTRKVLMSSESSSAMPSTTATSVTAPTAARMGDLGVRSESLR